MLLKIAPQYDKYLIKFSQDLQEENHKIVIKEIKL